MDSIGFELPEDLRGSFLLEVRNAVGSGYAVLELGDGVPVLSPVTLLGSTPPGEYRADAYEGANGIVFKGKFFIFPVNTHSTIEARTYDTTLNRMSAADSVEAHGDRDGIGGAGENGTSGTAAGVRTP